MSKTTLYVYHLAIESYADAVYNMRKTYMLFHSMKSKRLLKSVTACHMCAIACKMIIEGEY